MAVAGQPACLSRLQGTAAGSDGATREPAAVQGVRVGTVVLAVGKANVRRRDEQTAVALKTEMTLAQGDEIVTGLDGRVRVRFPDLSEIFVSPNTNLRIDEATGGATETKRSVLMQLFKGKVRSRVQSGYSGNGSRFEIRTKSAVAGVRGTDFVTSFEPGPSQWTTEVRTLDGTVSLKGLDSHSNEEMVTAMTFAAYVVPIPPRGLLTEEDVSAAVSRGYMSPHFKFGETERKEIDSDTVDRLGGDRPKSSDANGALNRSVSSATGGQPQSSNTVCQAPAADFNQCSWSCEGNPKGEKNCRTDLTGVSCVRRLCRANGQWAERTPLPSTQGSRCNATQPVVSDCGSYW